MGHRYASLLAYRIRSAQFVAEVRGDAFRGMTVPASGDSAGLPLSGEDALDRLPDEFSVEADKSVCPTFDGYGALCVLPQGQARDAENRGFLLYAAGVRENE